MKIYTLLYDSAPNARWCRLDRENLKLDGSSLGKTWTTRKCYPLNDGVAYDCVMLDMRDAFLLEECAISKLLPYIYDSVEVLPVESPLGNYNLINTTNVIGNVMDFETMDYEVFRVNPVKNGRPNIKCINKYAFKREKLKDDLFIFKLGDVSVCQVFVTDKFVHVIEKFGITGFAFKEIWSDEIY